MHPDGRHFYLRRTCRRGHPTRADDTGPKAAKDTASSAPRRVTDARDIVTGCARYGIDTYEADAPSP